MTTASQITENTTLQPHATRIKNCVIIQKKHLLSQVLFSTMFAYGKCCWLRRVMTALPNAVCLAAHDGKHRIIAARSNATSYLRSKCIISTKSMHHLCKRSHSYAKRQKRCQKGVILLPFFYDWYRYFHAFMIQ